MYKHHPFAPTSSFDATKVSSSPIFTGLSIFEPPSRLIWISAKASSSEIPSSPAFTAAFFRSYLRWSNPSTASTYDHTASIACRTASCLSGHDITPIVCGKYALDAERIRSLLGSPQDSLVYGPSHGLEPSHNPSALFARVAAWAMLRSALPHSQRIHPSVRSPLVPRSSIKNCRPCFAHSDGPL